MAKNKIIILIISVWAVFSIDSASGLANQDEKKTFIDSIVGYRINENHEWDGFRNSQFYEGICKVIQESTNQVVLLAVMPPDSAIQNSDDSNIYYQKDNNFGFKIITAKDSTVKRFVKATNHYYLFEDTIIPVIFEYDVRPLEKVFSDIYIE